MGVKLTKGGLVVVNFINKTTLPRRLVKYHSRCHHKGNF